MSHVEARYWDELADSYDDLYSSRWSKFEDEQLAAIVREVASLAAGPRVLDVGCGTGLGFELMADACNMQYTGVDLSAAMLAQLKRKHPRSAGIHASGSELSSVTTSDSFDVVLGLNVSCSFFGKPEVFLSAVGRALVPGGVALLSYLNRWSLRRILRARHRKYELYRTRGDLRSVPPLQAVTLSPAELRALLVEAGFQVHRVATRSRLGGVYEGRGAIAAERLLERLPWCGHEVYALAGKRR